jgi:predicted dehydrogenase
MSALSTRRQVLRAAAAFTIIPAHLVRAYAANEKLNLGIIGLTGMGGVDARTFNKLGETIAAICDVDSKILDKRGAEYPNARKYTDFRKMIEQEKLDGVSIAVPDHNHAYISVYAMKHGLHVYCQKPLTKSIREARVMAHVAARHKVITQMGTQTSAEPNNLRIIELIQSGVLGDIREVHLSTDRPIWPQGFRSPASEDSVPEHLDWDLWLGTSPKHPYFAKWPKGHPIWAPEKKKQCAAGGTVLHPFSWRGWPAFGSGAVGDIAPHAMNVVFMALGLGAPSAVEILDTSGMTRDMYPEWSRLRFDFPAHSKRAAMSIYWYDGDKGLPPEVAPPGGGGGLVWIGTKGSLPAGRGPCRDKKVQEYEKPPQREWNREEVHKDWVTAVKAGKQAPCNFAYAGPFTEAYLLGNVALRAGHRIEWDAKAFKVTNCREANQYLDREYRKGWEVKA